MRLPPIRRKPMHIALFIASVLYLIAATARGWEAPTPSVRGGPAATDVETRVAAGASARS